MLIIEPFKRKLKNIRPSLMPGIVAGVVAVIGLINLFTGLLSLFSKQLWGASLLPTWMVRFGGVMAIIFGSILILLGKYLWELKKLALYATMVLLGLLWWNSFFKGGDWPTMLLCLLTVLYLYYYRKEYTQPMEFELPPVSQLIAGMAVLFAMIYGVVGAYLLRENFDNISGWTDALYFTVVTFTTLGYGDILPITGTGQLFSISLVIVGAGSFLTAATMLVGPIIESKVKGVFHIMGKMKTSTLKGHVMVCGLSEVGLKIISELIRLGETVVVIDRDSAALAAIPDKKAIPVVGDASDDDILLQARISSARTLVACSDDDAANAFVILQAKDLKNRGVCKDLRILALAKSEDEFTKFRQAGADFTFAPASIGGKLMARAAMATSEKQLEALKAMKIV